jgi:hypothetical protein
MQRIFSHQIPKQQNEIIILFTLLGFGIKICARIFDVGYKGVFKSEIAICLDRGLFYFLENSSQNYINGYISIIVIGR